MKKIVTSTTDLVSFNSLVEFYKGNGRELLNNKVVIQLFDNRVSILKLQKRGENDLEDLYGFVPIGPSIMWNSITKENAFNVIQKNLDGGRELYIFDSTREFYVEAAKRGWD